MHSEKLSPPRSITQFGILILHINTPKVRTASIQKSVMSSDEDIIIQGGCYCGAVRYQTQGRPIRAAYCHCTLCQRLNGVSCVYSYLSFC